MSLLGDFQPDLKALRVCSCFHYLLLFLVIPELLFIFLFNIYTSFLSGLLLFTIYCISPELVFILQSLLFSLSGIIEVLKKDNV